MKAILSSTNFCLYPAFSMSSTDFSLFLVLFLFDLVQSMNKAHSNQVNEKKWSILTIFFNMQSNLPILSAVYLIPWQVSLGISIKKEKSTHKPQV